MVPLRGLVNTQGVCLKHVYIYTQACVMLDLKSLRGKAQKWGFELI